MAHVGADWTSETRKAPWPAPSQPAELPGVSQREVFAVTKDNVGQVRPSRKDSAPRLEADDAPEALATLIPRIVADAWAKTSPEVQAAVMADPETWPTLREHLARAEALR